ncbi:MAG: tetratricopeptide repeat protein [Desulfobacteraceae bacterium]|jgi:cytochrome c-type biogenesis protein CcmH/NrfG
MSKASKTLKGYVKTSNMYLTVLVAVSVGFLGGVLFSSYKSVSMAPVASAPAGMPSSGQPSEVPLTNDQSKKLAALIEATKATPDNTQVWTQLGHFYFDTGKPDKAIEAYEKSLSIDGNRPDVWTDLGVMYRRSGNPQKAVDAFDHALAVNSRHEIALFNKGVVFMHDLNDTKAAIGAWESLLEANPGAKAPNGQLVSTLITELKKRDPS